MGQVNEPIAPVDTVPNPSISEPPVNLAIVEKFPTLAGCEEVEDPKETEQCFQRMLISHIQQNLYYPDTARDAGIQGRVYVRFIIEKDASISNVEVLRGVHPSLDEVAVKTIESLKVLKPATQRGKAVRTTFNIPINFSLN